MVKALKPTRVVCYSLLVLLFAQVAFFSTSLGTFSSDAAVPVSSTLSFGLGSPISITSAKGATSLDIRWPQLVLNLGVSYLLAAGAAALFTRAMRTRAPLPTFRVLLATTVAIAGVTALVISKLYWGYFFARPGLVPQIAEVVAVRGVFSVRTEAQQGGDVVLALNPERSVEQEMSWARSNAYYCLAARMPIELERRGLLPARETAASVELRELYSLIHKSGWLARSAAGYQSTSSLQAIVIDARNASGDRLVFVGGIGGQVSNDHYPYYELVFRERGGVLRFDGGRRFFYDLAGFEGLDWYAIWILQTPVVVIGSFLGFVLVKIFGKRGTSRLAARAVSPA